VLIRAQQNLVNAKLLANPRILVLDNESAMIKIVSEIPYQELTETSGGGSIGSTEFKDAGVSLRVRPHLTRDDMIRLQLEPSFSVRVDTVTFRTGSLEYPQPVIDRRDALTTLLIQNGETVVLGGLRKKDVTKAINKVPLLGDIPLLGYLFRFEGEDTVNSELVVFITPWIVEKPVLSEREAEQYKITDFVGPSPDWTRAERTPATSGNRRSNRVTHL
jgi:type II secretory pathway component GspD/PulD (secretin)